MDLLNLARSKARFLPKSSSASPSTSKNPDEEKSATSPTNRGGSLRLASVTSMKKRIGGGLRKIQAIGGPTMSAEEVDDGLASLYAGLKTLGEQPSKAQRGSGAAAQSLGDTVGFERDPELAAEQDLSNFEEVAAAAGPFEDDEAEPRDEKGAGGEQGEQGAAGEDAGDAALPSMAMTEEERLEQEEQRKIDEGVEARVRRREEGIFSKEEEEGRSGRGGGDGAGGGACYAPSVIGCARGNTFADRFVRRAITSRMDADAQQLALELDMYCPRAEEDIIATLPEAYFEEDFDAMECVLRELPPREECSNYEGYVQTELSEKDIAKDHIMSELGKRVRNNSEALVDGMKKVADIDSELRRSYVQVSYARHKIDSAMQQLEAKALRVLRLRQRREKLARVLVNVAQLQQLASLESAVDKKLQTGDFSGAAANAIEGMSLIQQEPFRSLKCTGPMRDRLAHIISAVQGEIDEAILSMCNHGFDDHSYTSVIRSCLLLDLKGREDTQGHDAADEVQHPTFATAGTFVQKLENSIVTLIGDFASTAVRARCEEEQASSAMLEQLIEMLPPQVLRFVLVDCAASFAKLMHTHYCLTQWHRRPFDESNDDPVFLHRCAIDFGEPRRHASASSLYSTDFDGFEDDEEDDGEEEEDEEEEEQSAENPEGETVALERVAEATITAAERRALAGMDANTRGRLQAAALQVISRGLRTQRRTIWAKMAATLVSVLANVDFKHSVSPESLAGMLVTLESFLCMGVAFCGIYGAESESERLRGAIRRKCDQVFQRLHQDSIGMLRSYLEREQWVALNKAALEAMGIRFYSKEQSNGIGALLDQTARKLILPRAVLRSRLNIRKRCQIPYVTVVLGGSEGEAATNGGAADANAEAGAGGEAEEGKTTSIFESWIYEDNPFGRSERRSSSVSSIAEASTTAQEEEEVCVDPLSMRLFCSSSSQWMLRYMLPLSSPGAAKSAPPAEAGLDMEEVPIPSGGWVVTAAVYNAFCKVAGRYLQMMALMQGSSWKIWLGLEELFDLFFYSLLQNFSTQARLSGLLVLCPDLALELLPPSVLDGVKHGAEYKTGFGKYPNANQPLSHLPPVMADHRVFAALRRRIQHIRHGLPASSPRSAKPVRISLTRRSAAFERNGEQSPAHTDAKADGDRVAPVARGASSARATLRSDPQPVLQRHPSWFSEKEAAYNLSHVLTPEHDSPTARGGKAKGDTEGAAQHSDEKETHKEDRRGLIPRMNARQRHGPSEPQPLFPNADPVAGVRERIAGAETATLLHALLQGAYLRALHQKLLREEELKEARAFVEEARHASSQLQLFIYRQAAWSSLAGGSIAAHIEGLSWDVQQLQESANGYIEEMVSRGGVLHSFLVSEENAGGSITPTRKSQLWNEFCQACMETLIEGFSRVKNCSTEGRALMSMDIQALHQGLTALEPARGARSRVWADAYVKAFYYGEEDVVRWIEENHQSYQLRHIEALVRNGVGKNTRRKRRQELLQRVNALYPYGTTECALED